MILKYVKPEVGRGKSRSLQPKSIFFLEKCVSITHWASFGIFLHLEAFYENIEKYEEIALPNIELVSIHTILEWNILSSRKKLLVFIEKVGYEHLSKMEICMCKSCSSLD